MDFKPSYRSERIEKLHFSLLLFKFARSVVEECKVDGVNEGSTKLFPDVDNQLITKTVFLMKTNLLKENG